MPIWEPVEEDDEDRVYVATAPRPAVRQCPCCWKAALHSDVTRYVHEIAPCYPNCWEKL